MFFAKEAELPSLTLEVATQVSPFINLPRPGTKMTYSDFTYTFHVDEDMTNYFEIFNWMNNLGFPDDLDGYNRIREEGFDIVSDATLTLMTSAKNPNIEVFFRDLFPIALSPIKFDVGVSGSLPHAQCTVTFKYQRFMLNKLEKSA
jgi:hypothetical protein